MLATVASVAFASPQAEESAMAGHDMGDMPGNGTEPDLSKRPPFACAHLEVYREHTLLSYASVLTV